MMRMGLYLKREVQFNYVLEFSFPMFDTELMPDNKDRIAFKYGPIVLAGLLGKNKPDPVYGTPVLLTDNRNVASG